MLGGPSWPPKKVTDRAETSPLAFWLLRIQCQTPDSSLVGEPIAKCISMVNDEELSLIKASAARRSPSRVPCMNCSRKREKSSWPERSSTTGRCPRQPVRISNKMQKNRIGMLHLYTGSRVKHFREDGRLGFLAADERAAGPGMTGAMLRPQCPALTAATVVTTSVSTVPLRLLALESSDPMVVTMPAVESIFMFEFWNGPFGPLLLC